MKCRVRLPCVRGIRARALWNIKEYDKPTVPQMLAITRRLRTEGEMAARRLAEQIEKAARADL